MSKLTFVGKWRLKIVVLVQVLVDPMFEISFFFNPSIYDKSFKRVWELDQNISSLFLYLFFLSRESFNHLISFKSEYLAFDV